ncbi:hypothetical protein [uncultured Aquitalea sp.]|uniref:hypothetical protein n=1 Tax=uncultured Aquitalea sp. TaxID=540272 RepID=UPI0025FFE59D|nr:hypothetical protein [uncultured Aquitalea sp.]
MAGTHGAAGLSTQLIGRPAPPRRVSMLDMKRNAEVDRKSSLIVSTVVLTLELGLLALFILFLWR